MSEPLGTDPISERLDRIERQLERLTNALDQALPTVGMAVDAADEVAKDLQGRGVDIDGRTSEVLALVERLTEPATLDALDKVVDALPKLVPAVEAASTFEDTTAMVFDAADEVAAKLAQRGVFIDKRVDEMVELFDRLTQPTTFASLRAVVDALPRLEYVVHLAGTVEDTTGMLFDMADEHVKHLRSRGIDVEARFNQVLHLMSRLTEPDLHMHLLQLLDAAPNLLAATQTGELFGRAVDEVSQSPRREVGMWGLLSAMNDPQVKKAAGFAIDVARRVGQSLPEGNGHPQLPMNPSIPTAK